MSESVSNVKIEDVLSSIRRLVSEEHRAELRPSPRKSTAQSDRLVLTPALRVAEFPTKDPNAADTSVDDQEGQADSDSGPDSDSGFDFEPDPAPTEELAADPQWQDSHSDVETVDRETVDQPVSEWDADEESTAWLVPESESELESEPETDYEAADMQRADEPQDMPDEAPWRNPEATLFEADQHSGDFQPAEDATTYPDDTAEVALEPDTAQHDGPQDDMSADQASDLEVSDDAPDSGQPDFDQSEGDEPVAASYGKMSDETWVEAFPGAAKKQPDNDEDVQYDRAAALSAKIEALEATIGQTQDQWEPDGEVGDDYAGTHVETIEWQDHETGGEGTVDPLRPTPVHLDPVAEIPVPPKQDDDTLDTLMGDEAIMDEESLRELVADIVRQELQGALGERITRNVRKLVRREIHRALTAQELD